MKYEGNEMMCANVDNVLSKGRAELCGVCGIDKVGYSILESRNLIEVWCDNCKNSLVAYFENGGKQK